MKKTINHTAVTDVAATDALNGVALISRKGRRYVAIFCGGKITLKKQADKYTLQRYIDTTPDNQIVLWGRGKNWTRYATDEARILEFIPMSDGARSVEFAIIYAYHYGVFKMCGKSYSPRCRINMYCGVQHPTKPDCILFDVAGVDENLRDARLIFEVPRKGGMPKYFKDDRISQELLEKSFVEGKRIS